MTTTEPTDPAMRTTEEARPYTHIVHAPDRPVSHNFSMSGWNLKPRHAATYQPRKRLNFATMCGKELDIDQDHREPVGTEARRSDGLGDDARRITCARCRKLLGLSALPSRRRGAVRR